MHPLRVGSYDRLSLNGGRSTIGSALECPSWSTTFRSRLRPTDGVLREGNESRAVREATCPHRVAPAIPASPTPASAHPAASHSPAPPLDPPISAPAPAAPAATPALFAAASHAKVLVPVPGGVSSSTSTYTVTNSAPTAPPAITSTSATISGRCTATAAPA